MVDRKDKEPGSSKLKRKRASKQQDKPVVAYTCTICEDSLTSLYVERHPHLDVVVCARCNRDDLLLPFSKDKDGTDTLCSWCGDGGDIMCCSKCEHVFCQPCVKRNFGHAGLLRILEDPKWLCFFCERKPLLPLQNPVKKLVAIERAKMDALKARCRKK